VKEDAISIVPIARRGGSSLSQTDVVGDHHSDPVALLEGHDDGHELVVGGDDTAPLEAEERCCAVEHRVAVRLDEELV